MYEYETFVSSVELVPEDLTVSPEKMAENVTLQVKETLKHAQIDMKSFGNSQNPWEIVSHDILVLGKHLVVSFLVRRLA